MFKKTDNKLLDDLLNDVYWVLEPLSDSAMHEINLAVGKFSAALDKKKESDSGLKEACWIVLENISQEISYAMSDIEGIKE